MYFPCASALFEGRVTFVEICVTLGAGVLGDSVEKQCTWQSVTICG